MSEIVQVKKPRLEWLDALRGFTMILVVANHVANMGFGMAPKLSSSMQFLIMFRMPLFFFVSGFLAYKAAQVWDLKNLGSLLLKKSGFRLFPLSSSSCLVLLFSEKNSGPLSLTG